MPSKSLLTASVESITISKMPRMSSRTSTLNTFEANFWLRSPRSSKALYMIVVELMASIPPRKRLSILPQPNACPKSEPSMLMAEIIVTAAIMGELPIFIIFLKLNSIPRVNIRNITPMFPHVSTEPRSLTVGI